MTDDVRAAARRMFAAFNAHNHDAAKDIFTAVFYSNPLDMTGPDTVTEPGSGSMRHSPRRRAPSRK